MNDLGSLFIIDSCKHQQLAVWTWPELLHSMLPAPTSITEARLVTLLWSPRCSQLAVLARGLTALITFGEHLSLCRDSGDWS